MNSYDHRPGGNDILAMLINHQVSPTLPATNLKRARRFSAGKLGLSAESETPAALTYRCGAATSFLFPQSEGTASETHTQVAWVVDDLKTCGLVFEADDLPELRTVTSIATTGAVKAAWLKESEGNPTS